jgi:hypothetical protein
VAAAAGAAAGPRPTTARADASSRTVAGLVRGDGMSHLKL